MTEEGLDNVPSLFFEEGGSGQKRWIAYKRKAASCLLVDGYWSPCVSEMQRFRQHSKGEVPSTMAKLPSPHVLLDSTCVHILSYFIFIVFFFNRIICGGYRYVICINPYPKSYYADVYINACIYLDPIHYIILSYQSFVFTVNIWSWIYILSNILYHWFIYFLWCIDNTCVHILSYFVIIVFF